MVLQVCIACGKQVPLRVRLCTCGHVMAENVVLGNSRLRRNGEKRMRQVTIKLKREKTPNIEARGFYLGQAERLKLAEKGNNNNNNNNKKSRLQQTSNTPTSESEKRRERLLLLEQTKDKLEQVFTSPQFQQRMQKALLTINKKLSRQQTFVKLISRRETRLSRYR